MHKYTSDSQTPIWELIQAKDENGVFFNLKCNGNKDTIGFFTKLNVFHLKYLSLILKVRTFVRF